MRHEIILEKNGKITLPKDVIKKLRLNEGDKVIIETSKLGKEYYAYIASATTDFLNMLLGRDKPVAR